MIEIAEIQVVDVGGKSRISSTITVDADAQPLWFEVDHRFHQYLCYERSDAYVLGLLHYAMMHGHDISFSTPMTRRLYEQLTEQFLPAYYKANHLNGGTPIRLKGPLAEEIAHCGDAGIGAGVSCGVDSMHVFAVHPEITHGCIWNLHGETSRDSAETKELGWNNLKLQAEKFTSAIGIPLIVGNTNFDRGVFPDLKFDGSTTYGNLFCIFALQKLWQKYYVASGYDIDDFGLTRGVREDPAHYEWVLFAMVSLSSVSVRLDGAAQNRVEKVGDLINYEPSYHYLNVCWHISEEHKNCSCRCPKCMRTMIDIDAWDSLDKYREVFDVDYYRTHFHEYIAEIYRGIIQKNSFSTEVVPYFAKKDVRLSVKIKAWLIVVRKIVRKVLRGGKTSKSFSSRG